LEDTSTRKTITKPRSGIWAIESYNRCILFWLHYMVEIN
jgi:hypothetical protein